MRDEYLLESGNGDIEKKKFITLPHPTFPFDNQSQNRLPPLSEKYILLIGRIKKYKGFELFINSWAQSNIGSEIELVVAGQGKLKRRLLNRKMLTRNANFNFINRWLSDSEVRHLIENSSLVVFPYTEASQSGMIPTVKKYEKPLYITNTKGLIEQTKGYPYLHQADSTNDLVKMISKNKLGGGKLSEWKEYSTEVSIDDFCQTTLEQVSKWRSE